MFKTICLAMSMLLAAAGVATAQQPITSTFTYQGELSTAGNLANGLHDFRFRIYDDPIDGNQVNPELCVPNVAVVNGRFTVQIPAPNGFNGNQLFMEIDVRTAVGNCANFAGYTTLGARQPLTATPYASYALIAANATRLNGQLSTFYLNAGNLNSGSLPSARLAGTYTNALTLSSSANQFTGNGAGLANLNATNLSSGTLPDARLSANVARRDQANTFTLSNTFNQNVLVLNQLGVGTNTPDTRLHVHTVADVDANGGGGFTLGEFPSGAYLKADGNEVQAFNNGAVSSLNLNANGGRVGIGAGSVAPRAPFHVAVDVTGAAASPVGTVGLFESNSAAVLNLIGGSVSAVGLFMGDATDVDAGGLLYFNDSGLMTFRTNNLTRGGINGSGDMGIGTSSPVTRLHVVGSSDITGSGGGILTVGSATDAVRIDANEIQAFDADAPGTLFLNNVGGDVDVRGDLILGGQLASGIANPLAAIHLFESLPQGVVRQVAETIFNGQARSQWVEDYNPGISVLGGYINYNAESNRFEIGTTEGNFLLPAIRMDRGSLNVTVNGNLSKAGGSFRIDHPVDPENKFLYHSFVESPDMKNIYDGVAVTDAEGYAVVTLPDYFNALNSDYRYQLTVLDDEDAADVILWAKVVRKIGRDAPNQFTIRTSRPNLEVSWQVTGIRQDAWARANRIPNEVNKDGRERGKFLHPEAHGQPATRGIDYQEDATPAEREAAQRRKARAHAVAQP